MYVVRLWDHGPPGQMGVDDCLPSTRPFLRLFISVEEGPLAPQPGERGWCCMYFVCCCVVAEEAETENHSSIRLLYL